MWLELMTGVPPCRLLIALKAYDSGHCDDVQQKHDQKRARQFHVRF